MHDVITLRFTYDKDEYLRAVRLHYRKKMGVTRDIVIAVLCGAAAVWLFVTEGLSVWSLVAAGGFLALLGVVCSALVVVPRIIYADSAKLGNEYELTFRHEGIHFKTRDIDSHIDWELYDNWIEDDEFFILYYGKRNFSVVPKRAFSENQEAIFREHLIAKIGTGS